MPAGPVLATGKTKMGPKNRVYRASVLGDGVGRAAEMAGELTAVRFILCKRVMRVLLLAGFCFWLGVKYHENKCSRDDLKPNTVEVASQNHE